jgi:predicted ester cyclase
MSAENKDLVRRLVMGWQHEHRTEVAEALISDDFVDRSARTGERGTKQDGITFLNYMWTALPGFSVDIKQMIGEGDLVATLKTFTGTHQGEFLGCPPTGRRVTLEVSTWSG